MPPILSILDYRLWHRPLIVGGLLPSEVAMGMVQMRLKKHRWHKKILKSHDPVVFSLGWRRFQAMPIYATQDRNDRLRFLKYTPEHMHCLGSFYGPLTPPGTGLMAFTNINNKQVHKPIHFGRSINCSEIK